MLIMSGCGNSSTFYSLVHIIFSLSLRAVLFWAEQSNVKKYIILS